MAENGTLAKSQELQASFHTTTEQITIGIDLKGCRGNSELGRAWDI